MSRLSLKTWVQMMRPGFLTITAVACLLGSLSDGFDRHTFQWVEAACALVAALLLHAMANAYNDYHDALNGADDANQHGMFPFTGGSRLIQRGEVSLAQTRRLALVLFLLAVPFGAWLCWQLGGAILWWGLGGLFLAWAYSAPPLALMSRGMGEFTVALAWGGMVLGSAYVQHADLHRLPVGLVLPYSLLIANILLINGLPDAPADAAVGKRTLAVRLGPTRLPVIYGAVVLLAHGALVLAVFFEVLPPRAAWGLCSLPVALWAAWTLRGAGQRPETLRLAIVATIATALLHGLSLCVALSC